MGDYQGRPGRFEEQKFLPTGIRTHVRPAYRLVTYTSPPPFNLSFYGRIVDKVLQVDRALLVAAHSIDSTRTFGST
jgi:hypothetical protein